jgi:hypothetical protein
MRNLLEFLVFFHLGGSRVEAANDPPPDQRRRQTSAILSINAF